MMAEGLSISIYFVTAKFAQDKVEIVPLFESARSFVVWGILSEDLRVFGEILRMGKSVLADCFVRT